MDLTQFELARRCINDSLQMIANSANESAIRHSFTSYLRGIFPNEPKWVQRLIDGTEARTTIAREGVTRLGFIDSLVDCTVIEFESDLRQRAKFKVGFEQVREYSAALLNEGRPQEHIIGVLTDTVRWRAYRITNIDTPSSAGYGKEDITIEQIDYVDLSAGTHLCAQKLIFFLESYLGRLGTSALDAKSVARDLGFESAFYSNHIGDLNSLLATALQERPEYADLIAKLWNKLVNQIRDVGSFHGFERDNYVNELYLVTLGKLICANIIERTAIFSQNDSELAAILTGDYFKNKGLVNFVEYDFFGWLNEGIFLEQILPIARDMQADLRAFDFENVPAEDLFGGLLSELARRSHRLLLGQEMTPNWLARRMVANAADKLPPGEACRFVDVCCGSGAFIIETLKMAAGQLDSNNPQKNLKNLMEAITGFDIDPLAVLLAKINWIVTLRDWLEPLGSQQIVIPIFHADSLFVEIPLRDKLTDSKQEEYTIKLHDTYLNMPAFLVSPSFKGTFDYLLENAHNLVALQANDGDKPTEAEIKLLAAAALDTSGNTNPSAEQKQAVEEFLSALISCLTKLHSQGLNGIWSFILRNSYRPQLVAGQFNGVVTNPPWLALSRIADNPYKEALRKKAELYNITPTGSSFLHIELATIFLLHAVDKFLAPEGVVACITPETILNGDHQTPFRLGAFREAVRPIPFCVEELWKVAPETFNNKAVAVFGKKTRVGTSQQESIPGAIVDAANTQPVLFRRSQIGRRVIWTDSENVLNEENLFRPAAFRQGADIMPRKLFFHECSPLPASPGVPRQWQVETIDSSTSNLAYLIGAAKKHQNFRLASRVVPDDLVFDVLLSQHLNHFFIASPDKALLPIKKGQDNTWMSLTEAQLVAYGTGSNGAFRQILNEMDGARIKDIWEIINTRGKLAAQKITPGGYLLFTGTGGSRVCAAFAATDSFNTEKLIVDQTLNWAKVDSIEEALYLVGLLNSSAIEEVIHDFKSAGLFGARHIHSLPFGVTPPYNPANHLHRAVVVATKALLEEFETTIQNKYPQYLDPAKGVLQSRRRKVSNLLQQFSTYHTYNSACENVYSIWHG